jgi:hypothetical protein
MCPHTAVCKKGKASHSFSVSFFVVYVALQGHTLSSMFREEKVIYIYTYIHIYIYICIDIYMYIYIRIKTHTHTHTHTLHTHTYIHIGGSPPPTWGGVTGGRETESGGGARILGEQLLFGDFRGEDGHQTLLKLLYICPYTAIYVSSCCYICGLILLYVLLCVCPDTNFFQTCDAC